MSTPNLPPPTPRQRSVTPASQHIWPCADRAATTSTACWPPSAARPWSRDLQLGLGAARVVLRQYRRRADVGLVRLADLVPVLALVVDLRQHVLDRLEPGPFLVVALDHRPRGLGRVRVVEHRLL